MLFNSEDLTKLRSGTDNVNRYTSRNNNAQVSKIEKVAYNSEGEGHRSSILEQLSATC